VPDWRTTGARDGWFAVAPDYRIIISGVTTRERAHAVLDHLPEDRVEAALAALEAVEGRDTSVEAILARHGEERLSPEEFDQHFGSLPADDEG
jgi:hypothetical protein